MYFHQNTDHMKKKNFFVIYIQYDRNAQVSTFNVIR